MIVIDVPQQGAAARAVDVRARPLSEMYGADPRFAANYEQHVVGTAAFVRDAMAVYAEHNYA